MKKILLVSLLIIALFSMAYAGGQAKLSWVAPTTYSDGSALLGADIKEYRLYQGTASRTYPSFVTVPSTTTQALITVPTGTYFFTVTVVTKEGAESDYSNELSKYFPAGKPAACTLFFQP